jgi:hypothetical protein
MIMKLIFPRALSEAKRVDEVRPIFNKNFQITTYLAKFAHAKQHKR